MAEAAGSKDLADEFSVDLQNPISFTSDPTAAQKPYIKRYIDSNPQVFEARPDPTILSNPPQLVLQLQAGIKLVLASDEVELDLNNHILAGSPSLSWAAEVYQHIPQNTRAFLTSTTTPENLDAVQTLRLSPNFGVYFCKIGDDFYCGSGTSLGSNGLSGTLTRQHDRSTSRKSSNELCERIKAAEKAKIPVHWAQGMEIIGTKDLDEGNLGDLLHFRILSKLGEQLLAMGTCAHKSYLHQCNTSFWDTRPTWKGTCGREAWPEPIRGVSTPEIRNARKRIENLTPEQLERKRKRERIEDMTEEQHDARNARRRIENLTSEQAQQERVRRRVDSLSTEQVQNKRKRQKVENLTPAQLEKKRANDRIQNQKKAAKKAAEKALQELSSSDINRSTA
ncbi:hypothetical protein N0V82_009372 [Gnomoniopsis sp. IMI 355080]|nr:hypothetical protein N0V82_009372 [Gnomoniopsis sp. IMI 355080]